VQAAIAFEQSRHGDKGEALIEAHPDWGFSLDEFGELWEF
jgi:hypothetical protein